MAASGTRVDTTTRGMGADEAVPVSSEDPKRPDASAAVVTRAATAAARPRSMTQCGRADAPRLFTEVAGLSGLRHPEICALRATGVRLDLFGAGRRPGGLMAGLVRSGFA